ncbi:nucleoside 2-deoxyribosyltransferase [Streptomyces sp. NBC_00190]|uniref:nucleoside 2-deoxyribosyltransferase n=1 Tax=unclassified Streptomyces TaxID=2593676 RepID=UPI002E2813BD|nr:nucleoside 2-deoxyribosyltransferase [Streptomyces sp. NBC_00190]WSZ37571.1 nucleoside 2-deoxyribosyltransferase [Streptomyces sp. NBC_00868]
MVYYVAHRLFSAHDRALGARVAKQLADKAGPDNVFLPFCDTDEEDLIADVKGRRLYELDTERLTTLTGMIALLHGPSLDDGVCLEIGYAAALGVPVTVLTTDFQTYDPHGHAPTWQFPDPLVETIANQVIRVPTLGPASSARSRFTTFGQRNNTQLDTAINVGINALLTAPAPAPPATPDQHGVYIEPSPYTDDHELLNAVRSAGHTARTASRFTAADPTTGSAEDWNRAAAATTLVVDVSGPEAPPGAALLIGAAAARHQPVIAYQPRPVYTHAQGREPNWRNLMVQYASTGHATTLTGVTSGLAS